MTTTHHAPTRSDVTRLQAADSRPAGRTLAAAFQDDPVFRWLAPDAWDRRTHLPHWFEIVVEAIAAHGASDGIGNADGVALWVPPGTEPLSEEQAEHLGDATAPLGTVTPERSTLLTEAMDANHPHEPHHYLWFLAVAPRDQGRGAGSALLTSSLDELDRRGEDAYLEATSSQNRRLYERHGFEVSSVIEAAPGAPPLWAMWRSAR